ncbi:hypothetical protein [Limosilactobacillus difficilis]|uniref:hypothetical protein n=1 Tax=Limosilactobacillus difficilis TaxID=2991838 RepID=UPI0024B9578C|nr:hypothetical protein [Limosilactobacillus difficilis]
MGFLVVDVIKIDGNVRRFKLRSDIETATAELNTNTGKLKVDGFQDTLKYVFSFEMLTNRLLKITKSLPEQTHFCFGNG